MTADRGAASPPPELTPAPPHPTVRQGVLSSTGLRSGLSAAFYGDPAKHNSVGGVELGAVWEVLASKAYGRKQAARIDMARAMTEVDAGTPLEQATAVNKGEGDTIYAVRPPPHTLSRRRPTAGIASLVHCSARSSDCPGGDG